MKTNMEIDIDCFKRVNALATGRFLRNEASHWMFKSRHLQLVILFSLGIMAYIYLTQSIYEGLPLILILGFLILLSRNTLIVRFASGDCYVEGYRQGFIDAVITDHFDANLLSDDNQKGYIEARLKDHYSVAEKAEADYLELQRHCMRVGRLNAIAFFTREYRSEI